MGVSPLTINQHFLCLGIGSLSLLIGVIIKFIPNKIFVKLKIFKEEEMQNMDQSFTSRMRRKSSLRMGSKEFKDQKSLKSSQN